MNSFLDTEFQGFVHRGDTSVFLENTIEAFQSAVSSGYQYLETDLRETADGKIITFHDPNLKRITGANITISDTKFSDIRMRRLPSRETIPTIDELLEEFPASFFNMDLKVSHIEEKVLRKINSHNALERVCLGSFNSRTIKKINALEPKILTSMGISQVIMYKFFWKKTNSRLIQIPTYLIFGTIHKTNKPGINKSNKLKIPRSGLSKVYATQPTIMGPKTTADLPTRL